MEHILVFSSLNIDKAIQLAATFNFRHGYGILLSLASVGNSFEIIYYPFHGWPPGFTFCLAPFYFLFHDLIWVNRITDCLFIFFFFMGSRALINRLFHENRKEILAVFCLLNTFSFSPFHYYTSTDLYALTFFLWALFFLTHSLSGRSTGKMNSILIATCLFLSAFTRFAYLPLCLVIPLTMVVSGIRLRDRNLFRNGWFTLTISAMLSAGLFLFQKFYYGGTYLGNVAFQFLPENLLRFDPFVYRTFFFTEPFESKLEQGNLAHSFLQFAQYTITLLVLFVFVRYRFSDQLENRLLTHFYLTSVFTVTAVAGMLTLLSCLTPMQSFAANKEWTYVNETRYFAPAIFIFQLFISQAVFTYKKKWLAITFRYLAIFSFSLSFIYFSFKHYKVFMLNDRAGTFANDAGYELAVYRQVSELRKSIAVVLVASPDKLVSTLSIIGGGIPVSNYDSLLRCSSRDIIGKCILVECDKPLTAGQNNFIIENKPVHVFSAGGKDWYQTNLK